MGHPARIGRYQVTGELGRGAMGVVYRAVDPTSGLQVAIKVLLHAHDKEDLLRLDREARITAGARHPNVVTTLDAGREGAHPFVVFELVEGESLDARLRRAVLEPHEAARLFEPLARGLQHVHALGVIHRDIKPANVLLDTLGNPKLSDFGLARRTDLGASKLTATGMIVGTPVYMAPEQAATGRAEPRSDIYGLGATLYHALTGHTPFRGGDVVSVLRAVLEDPLISPSRLRPHLPPLLERICLRCLARDPAERYASAGELADALAQFAATSGGPVAARPRRRGRSTRRRPILVAVGAVAGLAALGVVIAGAITSGASTAVAPPPAAVVTSVAPVTEPPTPEPGTSELERLRAEAERLEAKGWPFDGALAAWRLAADLGDADAWARIARLHRWRSRYPEAGAALERARDLDPSLRSVVAETGYLSIAVDRGAQVPASLEALRALDRNDPDLYTLEAQQLLLVDGGRDAALQARARDLASAALARAPDHVDATLVTAMAACELGDLERAHQLLDRALELVPDFPSAVFLRARAFVVEGNAELAHQMLERVVALDPEDAGAWEFLGITRHRRRQHEAARAAFSRALELDPVGRFGVLIGRAQCALALGDKVRMAKDADLYLLLARGAPPDVGSDVRAHQLRAVARISIGDLEEAQQDQQHAVRLRPDLVELWTLGALLKLELDDAAGGLADAEEAVRLSGGRSAEPIMWRARAHWKLGDRRAAAADVTRGEALGGSRELRALRARLLVGEDAARARTVALSLIAEEPKSLDGGNALGEALVALGEPAAARGEFLKVLLRAPNPRVELSRSAWTQLMTLPDSRTPDERARDAETLAAQAHLIERKGDAETALEARLLALFSQPSSPARWLEVVRLTRRRSTLKHWYTLTVERARAAFPDDAAVRGAEAYALGTYGDEVAAIIAAQGALARDPECADALAALAVVGFSRRDRSSAETLALVERALRADPTLLEARALRAMLLLLEPTRLAEAVRDADDVVHADPGWAAAYHYRSAVRTAANGNRPTPEALADLRRAVELEPTLLVYAGALATACVRVGDLPGVVAALTCQLDAEPRRTDVLARRAVAHERAGDAVRARRDGLEAVRRLPFHGDRDGVAAEARLALETLSDPEVRAALAKR